MMLSTAPLSTRGLNPPRLTTREVEVLRSWVRHDSKSSAASELFITAATVNTHVNRIRAKYSASGRPANTKAALLARALQDGYVTLDEF
jgi:DNA-binding CsgD family transcriptional regulator